MPASARPAIPKSTREGGSGTALENVIVSDGGTANEAFSTLIGLPPDAIVDVRTLYDLVALDERQSFRTKVDAHVRTGQSLTIEVPIVRPDGERRYLEVALKPFGTSSRARNAGEGDSGDRSPAPGRSSSEVDWSAGCCRGDWRTGSTPCDRTASCCFTP